jgi:hypothetical protein
VFQGHDEPEIAVVGFGALGYAVADLARCRAIKATVYSDRETTLVDTRRKRADRTYRHVVLTSSQWDDYDLALSLATDRVTILGFPGRSEPTTSNPLRGLYPKGLTLRQIGERPLGRDLREIVDLMPYLRPEPLIERRVSWKDLGTVYRDRGPWLSALLEW